MLRAPADDNDVMLLAGILPQSVGPYVSLMIAGFVIGVVGHLSRSRWLIALGIILVFLAAVALPLVLNAPATSPSLRGRCRGPTEMGGSRPWAASTSST